MVEKTYIKNLAKYYGLLDDAYPVAFLQAGMLLESIIEETKGTYHDIFCYKIKSEFNEDKFLSVWKFLIKKHELLRAKLIDQAGEFYFFIFKELNINKKYEFYDKYKTQNILKKKERDLLATNMLVYLDLLLIKLTIIHFSLYFLFIMLLLMDGV